MNESRNLNIVITGGGSGIGAAIALSLSKDDNNIIICGRREDRLKDVSDDRKNIAYKTCDISDEEQVIDFSRFVGKKFKKVDVIINCAGVFGPIDIFDKTNSEQWKKTFEINTYGPYLIIKHLLELLLLSDTKKIVNFAGGGAFSPFPNYSAYAVSKAGIVRLSENLACELADKGVCINCVAPGFVATDLHKVTLEAGASKAGKQYEQTIKKIKSGSVPIEIPVNCVKFLISDRSKGLTGKTISATFDKWNSDFFQKSLIEISDSELYSLRRINLRNLDDSDELKKNLL